MPIYKLRNLNVDYAQSIMKKPLPEEIVLEKVEFEFSKNVRYVLIHSCSYCASPENWYCHFFLYSSSQPNRQTEKPIGRGSFTIEGNGKVTVHSVSSC